MVAGEPDQQGRRRQRDPGRQENGASALYTCHATDPEGSDTRGLSGSDSGAFAISETDVLTFSGPPDYESPADSGSDNVYQVTVEAGDDGGNTARLHVIVTVRPVSALPKRERIQIKKPAERREY
ncbi:MAG: cadherin repeat domain-containing protein [Chloroflexota bacterium]|nr:cadherin repeat domain-containing protein [Chloroflexota bacterium]